MNEATQVLNSAVRGASYNMLIQFLSRVITFLMNAYVLRHISAELLGVVNIRLTLLYTTILLISREAFRKACMKKIDGVQWRQTINLLWCTVPLGVVTAIVLSCVWVFLLDKPSSDYYVWGVMAYSLAAVLELCAEPLWIVAQAFLYVRLKVAFEAFAVLVRCVVTFSLLFVMPEWGLIIFIIAHLSYSAVYVIMYFGFGAHVLSAEFRRKQDDVHLSSYYDLLPQFHRSQSFLNTQSAHLVLSFFTQSFLKQVLTEGERYLMTFFAILSFAEQGIYDVINNLGSLVARFIFLPVEESFHLFFANTLIRGVPHHQQKSDSLHIASNTLFVLLRFASLVGFIILFFGYSYSYLLLDLYGGEGLIEGSGPSLLKWYCVYVLIIAINGVTECFVFATMSQKDVDRYNGKMILFSVVFLASALFLTHYVGSVGFIWANCINMTARILHSIHYIYDYFTESGEQPLLGLMPSLPVFLSLLISAIVTALSEVWFCNGRQLDVGNVIFHVIIGLCCLAVTAVAIFIKEKRLVEFIDRHFFPKRKD